MENKNLWIRACFEEDLPGVLDLMRQLSEHLREDNQFDPEIMRMHFQAMQKAPETYFNLVADVEGRVVGFISVLFYRTFFHKGGTALINELIVNEDLRGQGIGARLIETARSEALARDMDELEVSVEKENTSALGFYHRNGFDQEYFLLGMEFD